MLTEYQLLVAKQKLLADEAQNHAVNALQRLAQQLHACESSEEQKATRLSFKQFNAKREGYEGAIRGLYFYGRVGRGKTMLMDLFYNSLAIHRKKRVHFHRFMADIHRRLNQLAVSDKKITEPLTHVASSIAAETDLLCFDEFFVTDIADAMLLSGLLEALFHHGVVLVATSNSQPNQLYKNGLHRERFLPTIALIQQYCDIISIDGDSDYRLMANDEKLKQIKYFLHNDGDNSALLAIYQQVSRDLEMRAGTTTINNRSINYLAKTDTCVLFDFFALCSEPRSQLDYIVLADTYSDVFLINVPQFSGELSVKATNGVEDGYQRKGDFLSNMTVQDDEARRFIALVDEFYDRKIRLYLSAQVEINDLYQGTELAFAFKRCQSRLHEMQRF